MKPYYADDSVTLHHGDCVEILPVPCVCCGCLTDACQCDCCCWPPSRRVAPADRAGSARTLQPYYADDTVTLHHGDCLDVLRSLPDASVAAVVTDPPYGLEFMGREWDSFKPSSARLRTRVDGRTNPAEGKSVTTTPEAYVAGAPFQRWCEAWSRECLRILKPGGHLLAFGGTRTVHRLTCAVEDAGFEIRDGIDWLYASGFPKSLDVSKAIDKAAGADREVVGQHNRAWRTQNRYSDPQSESMLLGTTGEFTTVTSPATDDARRWAGWGTALKPAREPIVMARKPLAGTVAANVLAYGTGALNIDATRVTIAPTDDIFAKNPHTHGGFGHGEATVYGGGKGSDYKPGAGRWPSNVVLSHAPDCTDVCLRGCPVAELGEPSRFFPVFRYEAKAPTSERPRVNGEAHATVKPLDLMRWLVRLVTPPGGVVLDLFAGSGTTGEACVIEGFPCVLIEREAAYLPLITARLTKPLQPALDFGDAA